MEQVAGLAEEQQHAAGGGVRKKQAEVLARSLRALRNGLGRLWRRRSATITDYDPTFRVSYLGNVLTGWAKGTNTHFLLNYAKQKSLLIFHHIISSLFS